MAANGTTKNTGNNENTEVTEEKPEDKQVLFKVSERERDELKIVAILEGKGSVQALFSSVASDLRTKHREALDRLFSANAA